jgi:hypothetical protein
MKKIAIALVLVLLLAVGLLVGLGAGGWSLFGKTLAWNQDAALLEKLAREFLTDLQFKDFSKAGKYHTLLDAKKADIPKLIERMFAVKPEFLNIRDFEVVKVDLDPDGKRARTFFRSTLEILNTAKDDKPNKEKEVEGILYWHKLPAAEGISGGPTSGTATTPTTTEQVAEQWFMKLESSLH